ncbi:MAG: ABC transporter substrate-binding protein [Burkholderiales bacterium]|nr:ABC transporter substrate-binding protein [Burkholderiales bacterium]
MKPPFDPARRALVMALATLPWLPTGARAQASPSPDATVRAVIDEVLKTVAEDKELRAGNPQKFVEFVEARVVPYFDIAKMTRLSVGKGWRQATGEQQRTIQREFQALLVRAFAAAYTAYRLVKVDVKPLKLAGDEEEVTVKTVLQLPGGAQPVGVDYQMSPSPAGWKVWNVVVENVSLVTTYRTEFGQQIDQGGIDGLIQ